MRRTLGGVLLVAAFLGYSGAADAKPPTIHVLSNRADLISGGEALVDVSLPARTDPRRLRVSVGQHDETSAFALRPTGNVEGLVTGLANGPNTLTARTPRGTAEITITNHPIGGPVIAGPQVQPWICGDALGSPQDVQCDAPTQYSYIYKSSIDGTFKPYDPSTPPSDVATTTTDQGINVPYIVRIEQGVEDREYYSIAVLYNPAQPWTPWQPQAAWNHKLLTPFWGDCNPWHQQSLPTANPDPALDPPGAASAGLNVLVDQALSRGFAVASSGGMVLGADCNNVVSAETLMMLKEHLIDSYGTIRFTIGQGCSGGSMQMELDAADYPGLLNGILPNCGFPDVWSLAQEVGDCHLLDNYFDHPSPGIWQNAGALTAVYGFVNAKSTCENQGFEHYAPVWFDPTNAAGCSSSTLPPPGVFKPIANPDGVRCTLADYEVNIWGRRADGFANRPFDNVGVQYGLKALFARQITAAQFVDLNSKIGGLDINGNPTPQRTVADPGALRVAYRSGQIPVPRATASVPIIDDRGSDNDNIHGDMWSYALRARLDQANGGHGNDVIYTSGVNGVLGNPEAASQAFNTMDNWLSNIEFDHRSVPLSQKVLDDKPAAAVDTCWIGTQAVTNSTTCDAQYPHYADPRLAAGAPMTDNYASCQLKPLNRADYPPNTFTGAQWATVRTIFPSGVCDWSKLPVGFRPTIPWLTYATVIGGQPLQAPPISRPISGRPRGHRRPAM